MQMMLWPCSIAFNTVVRATGVGWAPILLHVSGVLVAAVLPVLLLLLLLLLLTVVRATLGRFGTKPPTVAEIQRQNSP